MTVIQFPEQEPAKPLSERVSDEVRALLARHRLSQADLAAWMRLDQSAVSARLRGATEWKVSEIELVARGFGVHPSELMGGHATNPRPSGPGGGVKIVRHQGLEPRTRCLWESASDQVELAA